MDPLSPASRGARTLTAMLDRWREVKPNKIFASLLRSADISNGFIEVTMANVADAVDAFAWWLESTYGRSDTFETLTYVGVNDLRYAIFFYGAIKCGYKSLFVSPRNPAAQNVSLLDQTACRRIFFSTEMAKVVEAVKSLMPALEVTTVQPLSHWIDAFVKPYPYTKSYEDAKWDPIAVLHSSGSTGAPKPITLNHGYFAAAERPLPSLPGRHFAGKPVFDFPNGGSFFCPFPLFHLAGLTAVCQYPVNCMEASVVVALPDRPPTPLLVKQIMDFKSVKAIYSPPSIIEAIAQLQGGMDTLCSLETVIYAGGPLSLACGNELVKKTLLTTTYGSTETGGNHMLIPHSDDWNYLEFHPDFGIRMEPEPAVDGASELVFRNDDPQASCRGVYWTFPHLKEFRTRDLFLPHPTKPDLWTFYARNDDIIVLANGAKYNPVPAEGIILGNSLLSGVLIIGDGRTQTAALLEPKEKAASEEGFIDKVWPSIVEANKTSQKQGQLTRNMVVVGEPGSFARAAKGTVVRKATAAKFKDVLEGLYAGERVRKADPTLATSYNLNSAMLDFVRACTGNVSHIAGIGDEEDFYVRGLDSVQNVEFVGYLRTGLQPQYGDLPWLTGQTVFEHPTVKSLAAVLAQDVGHPGTSTGEAEPVSIAAEMGAMVEKYSGWLGTHKQTLARSQGSNSKVLLTGSTGFLGLRILQALLPLSSVTHIYCLDRSAEAASRVLNVLESRKDLGPVLEKLTFYTGQLQSHDLGLSKQEYGSLLENVNLIIHNAWKVDFNHSLATFEHIHVQGVSNLLKIATQGTHHPLSTFISSISAVSSWPTVHGAESPVPESIVSDGMAASPMGYGQSKQVAERILGKAAAAGVPVSIMRVGQITGSIGSDDSGPHWNKAEWAPALLQSSKELAALPSGLPDVDWIPVDTLGSVIAEIAIRDVRARASDAQVYHLANPSSTPWADLLPAAQARFGGASACPIIPLDVWLARLKTLDVSNAELLRRYPALKIVRFYEGLSRTSPHGELLLEKGKASKASEHITSIGGILPSMLDQWMELWGL